MTSFALALVLAAVGQQANVWSCNPNADINSTTFCSFDYAPHLGSRTPVTLEPSGEPPKAKEQKAWHTAEEIQYNATFHYAFDDAIAYMLKRLREERVSVDEVHKQCDGFITESRSVACAFAIRDAEARIPKKDGT